MVENLVSINITTYNRAHLIERCINSILSQTYINIELVIVDDASIDNTTEIVQSLQQKDPRIKYFKHDKNSGNAYSRNTAYENCRGEYVAFMDDDDEWIDNKKIEKQVKLLDENNKIDIVCSGIVRFTKDGQYIKEPIKEVQNIKHQVLSGGLLHNSTVLVRKKVMDEVRKFNLSNLPFDTTLPRGIDSDFFRCAVVKLGANVFFMKELTTQYNENVEIRMTDSKSIISIKKDIQSNELCLNKYNDEFKQFYKAKLIRKQRYIRKYVKLIFMETNVNNLIAFMKYLYK